MLTATSCLHFLGNFFAQQWRCHAWYISMPVGSLSLVNSILLWRWNFVPVEVANWPSFVLEATGHRFSRLFQVMSLRRRTSVSADVFLLGVQMTLPCERWWADPFANRCLFVETTTICAMLPHHDTWPHGVPAHNARDRTGLPINCKFVSETHFACDTRHEASPFPCVVHLATGILGPFASGSHGCAWTDVAGDRDRRDF